MKFPQLSGMIGAPFKAFSAKDDDTFTSQEYVDGVWGAAAMAGVGATIRANSVVKKQLGDAGYKKYKEGKIGGLI